MEKTRRLVEPLPPEKEPKNSVGNAPLTDSWLTTMAGRGIEVVETKWYHEEFIPSGEGVGSVVRFMVHATGAVKMPYIVRGKLRVAGREA